MISFNLKKISLSLLFISSLNIFNPIQSTKTNNNHTPKQEITLEIFTQNGRVNYKTSGKKFGEYKEPENKNYIIIKSSHSGETIYLCPVNGNIYNSVNQSEKTCIGTWTPSKNSEYGFLATLYLTKQNKETQTDDYSQTIEDVTKNEEEITKPIENKQFEQSKEEKDKKEKDNIDKLIKIVKEHLHPSYDNNKHKQTDYLDKVIIPAIKKISNYLKNKKTTDKIFIHDIKKIILDPAIRYGNQIHSKENLTRWKNNLDESLKFDVCKKEEKLEETENNKYDMVLELDKNVVLDNNGCKIGSWRVAANEHIYVYTENNKNKPNEENVNYELISFLKNGDLTNECNEIIGTWKETKNNGIKIKKWLQSKPEILTDDLLLLDYCDTIIGDHTTKLHNDLYCVRRFNSVKTEILDLYENLQDSFGNVIGKSIKNKDGRIFIKRTVKPEENKVQNKKENQNINKNNEQKDTNAKNNTVNKNNNNQAPSPVAKKGNFDFSPYSKWRSCKVNGINYIQLDTVNQLGATCGIHSIKNARLIDEFLQTNNNSKKSLENINCEAKATGYLNELIKRGLPTNWVDSNFIEPEIKQRSNEKLNPNIRNRITIIDDLRELIVVDHNDIKEAFKKGNYYHIFIINPGGHWYVAAIDKKDGQVNCLIIDSMTDHNHTNIGSDSFQRNQFLCEQVLSLIEPEINADIEIKNENEEYYLKKENITIVEGIITNKESLQKNTYQQANSNIRNKMPIDQSNDLSKKDQILTRQPLIDKHLENAVYETCPQELKNLITNYKTFGNVPGLNNHLSKVTILHGPNGTGKTTLGSVIARRTDREVLIINSALLSNTYRNSAIKHLEAIFTKIAQENKPYIIVVDEADVLTRERKDQNNNEDIDASFSQLLDSYENNPNFLFICTTNHPEMLENKFSSRLTKKIEIKAPDLNSRIRIVQNLINTLGNVDLNKNLTAEYIAKKSNKFDIRKIKNLINESYFKAARRLPEEVLMDKEALKNMNFRVVLTKEDIDTEYKEVKNTINEKTLWQKIKKLDEEYGISKTVINSTIQKGIDTGISEAHYKFIGKERETNSMVKGALISILINLAIKAFTRS